MGVVFAVTDPVVGRRLALKLIREAQASETARARFWREAEVMARIQHPNVVKIHKLGKSREGPYLLMELVEGEPLKEAAAREGWGFQRTALVIGELTEALEAVHAQGVLHRDLKPGNIMIRPDGSPVLLDFGLARDVEAESLTATGRPIGTPYYMAPEQARAVKSRQLTPRCDVYGLGAVLFHLLAGEPPFKGEYTAMVQVFAAVLHEDPRWPSEEHEGIPVELEAICRMAMAKDPARRYADMAAFREDLDRYRRGDESEAGQRLGLERDEQRVYHGLRAALGLACGVLAVVVGLILWRLTATPDVTAIPSPAPSVASSPTPAPVEPLWKLALGDRFAYSFRFQENSESMHADLAGEVAAEATEVLPDGRLRVANVVLVITATFRAKGTAGSGQYDTREPDERHPLAGIGEGVGKTFAFTLDPRTGALSDIEGVDAMGEVMARAYNPTTSPFFSFFPKIVRRAFSDSYIGRCMRALVHLRGEPNLAWGSVGEDPLHYRIPENLPGRPSHVSTLATPWRPKKSDRWSFSGEARYDEGRLRTSTGTQRLLGGVAQDGKILADDRECAIVWDYRELPAERVPAGPIRHQVKSPPPSPPPPSGIRFRGRLEPDLSPRVRVAKLDVDTWQDVLVLSETGALAISGRDGRLLWREGGRARRGSQALVLSRREVLVPRWRQGGGATWAEATWLDAQTGLPLRRVRLASGDVAAPGNPVATRSGILALLYPAKGSFVAGVTRTGKLAWKFPLQQLKAKGTLAADLVAGAGGRVLVAQAGREFVAFRSAAGAKAVPVWRQPPPGPFPTAEALSSPLDDAFLLCWRDARKGGLALALVDAETGQVRWRREGLRERYRRMVWADVVGDATPELIVSSLAPKRGGGWIVRVLDLASGRDARVLQNPKGTSRVVAPCRVGKERLLALSNSSAPFEVGLYGFKDPKRAELRWKAKLTWPSPLPDKSRLYLRRARFDGERDELFCWTHTGFFCVLSPPKLGD
jgi:hypothetical protein